MSSLQSMVNKTRKMLRKFFGSATKPVVRFAKKPIGSTKKVVKGAVSLVKKPVRTVTQVAMHPMKATKGLAKSTTKFAKSAKKSVRATTRRLGRLVKF
jgi:hypothetical protein